MKITMSQVLHDQLKKIVFATDKETGACLFGEKTGEGFRILGMAGPGGNAKHRYAHFRGDHQHYEDVYNELLKENPALLHLGEFHVHPGNMSELSCGDRHTIKKVLKIYKEFIAGVILRMRTPDKRWPGLADDGGCLYEKGMRSIKIFPWLFTKDEEVRLELVIE
jgi:hypothetical protein